MLTEANTLPSFYDGHTTDVGKEAVIDYNLSWTLKCSQDKYREIHPIINKHARNMVFTFLYFDHSMEAVHFQPEKYCDHKIISVEVTRQWEKIDIVAEITIEENETINHYVLIFENKMYTSIHSDQLERYKEIVLEHYANKKHKPIFLFIKGETINSYEKELAQNNGYKTFVFVDIKNAAKILDEKTGNELFDEFWFNYW